MLRQITYIEGSLENGGLWIKIVVIVFILRMVKRKQKDGFAI
ncbi:MAG: hypothetical protein RHS_2018 [Robinsoniella sp. RHS]|nr:MAG: hypothetical protein RHS_2018 [Robinsoniella sp. RHS]